MINITGRLRNINAKSTMYDLIKYLLVMSKEFPDGFTMSLPNGHLLTVAWMWGWDVEDIPNGIKIKEAFGMKLSGEFGETIITVYVSKG